MEAPPTKVADPTKAGANKKPATKSPPAIAPAIRHPLLPEAERFSIVSKLNDFINFKFNLYLLFLGFSVSALIM